MKILSLRQKKSSKNKNKKRRKSKQVRSEDVEINAWLKFINGEINKMPFAPEEVNEETYRRRTERPQNTRKPSYSPTGYQQFKKGRSSKQVSAQVSGFQFLCILGLL